MSRLSNLAVACWLLSTTAASGQGGDLPFLLYQQSFETGLPSGVKGDLEGTGWDIGNSSVDNAGVWHPTTAEFTQVPLAAPADGNHVLFIDDLEGARDNTFVAVNTGIVVEEDATYRIVAATGHPLQGIGDQSIQGWIQPPPLDGGINRRGFVGQSFTTFSWQEADPGQWIDNAYQFTAAAGSMAFNPANGLHDLPIVGSELIILVTNFNSNCCGIPGGQPGIVVWDNFRVYSDASPGMGAAGDFNGDGKLDVADIDFLSAQIAAGATDPPLDLNGDGDVNDLDRGVWVRTLKRTWFGDANLDGLFNTGDLVTVFQVGKYETGQVASWGDGDWSGDGRFDTSDLVTAFQDGGFELGPRPSMAAVPEPASLYYLLLIALVTYRRSLR
jgi:hypothetical protein